MDVVNDIGSPFNAAIAAGRIKSVPLRDIAAGLGVSVTLEAPSGSRASGTIWKTQRQQPDLFGDIGIEVAARGHQKWFALAHELAHVLCDRYIDEADDAALTADERRRMMNEIAARLLVPDVVLQTHAPAIADQRLSLQWIEKTASELRAPISCLLGRVNDWTAQRRVILSNCALIAVETVSTKSRRFPAPRVLVSCGNHDVFIPANKRLSSSGLRELAAMFYRAQPFVQAHAEDTLLYWDRRTWKKQSADVSCRYVVYSGEPSSRALVAVLEFRQK